MKKEPGLKVKARVKKRVKRRNAQLVASIEQAVARLEDAKKTEVRDEVEAVKAAFIALGVKRKMR